MSLENLLKINQLQRHAATAQEVQRTMVGLMANGYRPSTTTPGHHQTMIQSLGHTLGVGNEVWIVLDSLRKKRNLNDYSGDLIEPAAVRSCVSHAQSLLNTTRRWLSEHRPDLVNQTP